MTKANVYTVTDKLWDYPGGVHPEPNKSISARLPIGQPWLPRRLTVQVRQHIGQTAELLVKPGDSVLKGQPLTGATHGMTVPVHAPTSGEIIAIEPSPANHPSGLPDLAITIQPDGKEQWCERTPRQTIDSLSDEQLLELVQGAGIAGLGGAGFPTQVKLSPLNPIRLLLINGAECEPYITADDTLMQAHAQEVVQGSAIMARLLGQPTVIIAIESDKPKAIEAIELAISGYENFYLKVIPTKYPSGGERQLVQIITGQEVPSNGLPADLGIVVQNVGTAFAVKQAVYDDIPLIQRVVTLTGERVQKPGNHWVLLGTPIDELLTHHKVDTSKRVIVGGPMMGYELPQLSAAVIKTTNCLIAPSPYELPQPEDESPCIRCGACAEACPVSLLPQQLHWYAKAEDEQKLTDHNLFDCIECGACAYVCPSSIPLVLEYRQAKAKIRQTQADQQKAEHAKQRFEARNERLEQEKKARELKHKQAAETRLAQAKRVATGEEAGTDKSAMIAAALARAKAKKQQQAEPPKAQVDDQGQLQPDNSAIIAQREARKAQARAAKASRPESNAPTQTQDKAAQVAAAVARAKAKRAQQAEATANTEQSPADDKAAKVAAAVARAKAKRAQQAEATADVEQSPVDDKAAKVAAAVARAKAKRAQQAEARSDVEQSPADDKAAKVAAAVARAKAKRAQQAEASTEAEQQPTDDKAAKIAAAVARAKAKQAASATQNTDKPDSESAIEAQPTSSANNKDDDKKARIAAAVAKAKAKHALKEKGENSRD